jgi:hypothetical protein
MGTSNLPSVKVLVPGPAPLLSFTGPKKVPTTLVADILVITIVNAGIWIEMGLD